MDESGQQPASDRTPLSDRHFRHIVDSMPLGIMVYRLDEDENLLLVDSNPAANAQAGADITVLHGKKIEEAFPPLAGTEIPQRYRAAARDGTSWQTEQVDYDDNQIVGAFQVYVFQSEPGTAVVTFSNITEQVRAAEALRAAEAERARLQDEIIHTQQQAIEELSAPIIPIIDRVIIMPLVGSIDSTRARDIMRAVLAGIGQYRARIVILDITGVPLVDTGVANHLNHTIQAARLKGADTIITGVSDAVAETIVDMGIDWRDVETLRDLQTGLTVALRRLGLRLDG